MAAELLVNVNAEALRRARELSQQQSVFERVQLVYVLARTGEDLCG